MAGDRTGDRHAKDQLNVRFPAEVLVRLKDSAKRHGETQTGIVVRGTVAELDRLDSPTASPPPPPVTAAQPQPARRHALTCKCGTCRPE